MGATSLVNVTAGGWALAPAGPGPSGQRATEDAPTVNAVVQIATVARRLAVISVVPYFFFCSSSSRSFSSSGSSWLFVQ
jgi:hypothetical protein